ncbi:hypothetical protein SMACR_06584 [Sordaria macrospora]|uniref:WGS project CABT00000000 data, contig 2.37 n=2 Tax=Sordaria macrospora TaxID=5147 RepID=F7W703_SORMK|nr:uncharacterized protein SMAC_06584 [Sordaria macrospora k-hell]KAA8634189.1 hypothetical protein SMACR_06584 [Sordaria macrospora]KAH7633579.1 hypothetical protein B0T09DRAFT_364070 [Sordaria sp. MPI-SDFR-AT-0083]WPJ60032.1 hypothetical protein SMAC4_06584 [Sordaria macrospora]CCC13293.1 unnamed protein product [Sordaria macrospora k-hell]
MWWWVTALSGSITPLFIILSPILSYGDQAHSMHKAKSSAGFSLDIPLIMLVASLLRIFYYPGAKYDTALLIQSLIMVGVQIVLLKVALDHRPAPSSRGGDSAVPFAKAQDEEYQRPYNFWQWKSPKPYWQFVLYFFAGLVVCQILFSPFESLYMSYSSLIGYIGLSIEATLPIPQILVNHKSRSCKGFRVSVLAMWLAGDAMKMFWFFTSAGEIPWSFKGCGIFQACCDSYLGVQYLMYGSGEGVSGAIKDHPLDDYPVPGSHSVVTGREGVAARRTSNAADKRII